MRLITILMAMHVIAGGAMAKDVPRNSDPVAIANCVAAREYFNTNGRVDCTRVDTQKSFYKWMHDPKEIDSVKTYPGHEGEALPTSDPVAVANCVAARKYFNTNGRADCTHVDTQKSFYKSMHSPKEIDSVKTSPGHEGRD